MDNLDIKLKSKHIAPFCRVLTKIGVNSIGDNFMYKEVTQEKDGKEITVKVVKQNEEMVLDLAKILISNYANAEKEINTFISVVTGLKVGEIQELELDEFIDVIKQIFTCSTFKNFFSLAEKFNK